MNIPGISSPIYIKASDDMPWPKDKFFYLLAREGLFVCRNHPFFRSSVKLKNGLPELAHHSSNLVVEYPKIPQAILERAVGFFQLVADKQNSEAAVILAWNRQTEAMEMIVPDQTGINSAPSTYSPKGYPIDVKYEIPTLPPHLALIGDIHCHVDGSAYASSTDANDETHRAGIHIVVGKIDHEPPEFHCDVVADGERFRIYDITDVIKGYQKRRLNEVPLDWLDKVKLKEKVWDSTPSYGTGYVGGVNYLHPTKPNEDDKARIQKILAGFARHAYCPELMHLRSVLFSETKATTYDYCEERAKKFIASWDKIKSKQGKHEKKTVIPCI